MKEAITLKNSAALRNLTDLTPILPCETRWSGKMHLIRRYLRIHSELCKASTNPDATFSVDTSPSFLSDVKRYHLIVTDFDSVNVSLQRMQNTLADCFGDLDVLINLLKIIVLIQMPVYIIASY